MKLSKPEKMKLAKIMGLRISTVYFKNGTLITSKYVPSWTLPIHNSLERKFYCRRTEFNPAENPEQGYRLFMALLYLKPLLVSKMLSKLSFEAKTKGVFKKPFLDSICSIGLI